MAAQPDPIVRFDPAGKASILSYNVPEPTSYPGRNYIDLNVPDTYFLTSLITAGAERPDGPDAVGRLEASDRSLPDLARLTKSMRAGFADPELFPDLGDFRGTLRLVEDDETGPQIVGNEPLSPELAGLQPEQVAAMMQAGKKLIIHRTMAGTLSYVAIQALPRDRDRREPPTEPRDPVVLRVRITSHKDGDTVSGPPTGINLSVAGTTEYVSGERAISHVDVQIGSGEFKRATPTLPSNWDSWTFSDTITAAGPTSITARLTDSEGLHRVHKISIRVVHKDVPPAQDTTAPVVNVTSPADATTITFASFPPGGATVELRGTASDDVGPDGAVRSGVQFVEVTVDKDAARYKQATPKAEGDWSTWTASVTLDTPGRHTITARCRDRAENEQQTTIAITLTAAPPNVPALERLLLVERYRLSSYLGNYGAGRTLKTFSLLPGEKTKVSIKSYTKTETEAKNASSILDSFSDKSATSFETAVSKEQSNQTGYQESFQYGVKGQAEATWGWGKASISAEVSGGSNAAREELAKNISNVTQKHAAEASAKRDVQVNTSYERREQAGEETAIERQIENINVSRTLNFVFRQMNQEFVSLLHFVDVRIGYFALYEDGTSEWREVTLPQLASLVDDILLPAVKQQVRDAIVYQLSNVFDYLDERHSFVEEKVVKDPLGREDSRYLRARKDLTSVYKHPETGLVIEVPGLILAADRHVLRTDAVVVEALLGQAEGLDGYSSGLQDQAVMAKRLANRLSELELEKGRLAARLVEAKDEVGAKIFEQVFEAPPQQAAAQPVVTAGQADNGTMAGAI